MLVMQGIKFILGEQHYRNMQGPCKRLGYMGSVERV